MWHRSDFVVGEAPTRCREGFELMIMLLTMIGFVANEEKCSGPGTVQIFLGVWMDSDTRLALGM